MISTRPSAGWMLARWAQGASPASQSRACWWAASTAPEGLFLLLLLCPSPLQPEKHPRALLPEDARCQSLSSSPSRKERELFRLALCTWPGWSPPPLPWGRRRVMLLAGTVSLTPWGWWGRGGGIPTEVSHRRWVAEQLAEGRAPLHAFQPGFSPAQATAQPRRHGQTGLTLPSKGCRNPSSYGTRGGPRRWFCARGAAASHRTPDPELHPVCAQPLSVSNPYKWRGHDGQNQPNRCFVHQCLLSLLASLQIRYFMHSSW